ncbi:hypothetical protein C9994_08415 [Marivirga lumbricoides]|uniref:PNPLA domain-containing protein n=1 Tax=Marivirga lumbricoides TaxID=1046115 RepID=A0A2T4DQU4_9BACT|nr:hypothetical protein C9994_08415 [Marivirga lumbricoides]
MHSTKFPFYLNQINELMTESINTDKNTFHLGLTMAGAVSGGAYTGGVMDYFFEVLDKWEKAKEEGLISKKGKKYDADTLPQHNVIIEVMGGTSAGGMATIMSAIYALNNKINPVFSPPNTNAKTNNIFYDTWVNMLDGTGNKNTLQKALSTEDLKDNKIYSLLNSNFIDQLAEEAFQTLNSIDRPNYISPDLEMLITHSMHRGIPLTVDFPNNLYNEDSLKNPPDSTTYEHFLISHFKYNYEGDHYFDLDPTDEELINKLRKTAKATGAFPIGLRYREFDSNDFSPSYLESSLRRIITDKHDQANPLFDGNKAPVWHTKTIDVMRDYQTTSMDGGAINNEPYGEVLEVLKKRTNGSYVWKQDENSENPQDHHEYQKAGVVMIDPFPDTVDDDKEYEHPEDMFGIIFKIIKTLWNQSKVKRKEMRQQYVNKAFKGTIFPVKRYIQNNESLGKFEYPLACATLEAFGGFLDKSFREHDFFLGRDNARNFIRAIFSMPYDPDNNIVHPIHRDWSEEMIDKFKINYENKTYLPIIPDMNMLLEGKSSSTDQNVYTVPNFTKIKKSAIRNLYANLMKKRIKVLLNIFRIKYSKAHWSIRLLIRLAKLFGSKPITNEILKKVNEDLKEKGFLEGSTNRYIDEGGNYHTAPTNENNNGV